MRESYPICVLSSSKNRVASACGTFAYGMRYARHRRGGQAEVEVGVGTPSKYCLVVFT